MNWNNLKNFKCPKCSANLKEDITVCNSTQTKCATSFRTYNCTKCTFRIGEQKYNEILRGGKKIYTTSEEENLLKLNNL